LRPGGNTIGGFGSFGLDYGALRDAAIDPETGIPVMILNRDGELGAPQAGASVFPAGVNRRHPCKTLGFYSLPIGKYSLNLGGTLFVRPGLRRGLVAS
jgi:hypothetical protein